MKDESRKIDGESVCTNRMPITGAIIKARKEKACWIFSKNGSAPIPWPK
jgi:hypothetical protein